MDQSASYMIALVNTTNRWSYNSTIGGDLVLPSLTYALGSSTATFNSTNIVTEGNGIFFRSANISNDYLVRSYAAPSADQIFGFIRSIGGDAELEYNNIFTAGATNASTDLINQCTSQHRCSSTSLITSGRTGSALVDRTVVARRAFGGLPGGGQSLDLRQDNIRVVQMIGGGTAASFDPQVGLLTESRTTPQGWGGSKRALRDLEDFGIDDWDGEGARAISADIIHEAARLLGVLPDNVLEPEVAPASDGSICMEWDSSGGSLWLDIGPDRTVQTLVTFGALKEERRFRLDAPDIEIYLREASARLYPNKPDLAIWSIMLAA